MTYDHSRTSSPTLEQDAAFLESNVGIALNELGSSRTGNSLTVADPYWSGLQALEAVSGRCDQLEAAVRRALARQEFRVCYQPIVSLETGQIGGFEALVRWQHPTRGLLSPVDFLQATEENGLIVPLGLWVLRQASRQLHQWHRRFPGNPLYLSVNISSKQFQQPNLVEQISQILHETGLNPASLKLEITESLVMQNSESARNILLQLRALNVKLAIDDFGTGYSSLSYLQKFPVHTLKIDHSFISKLQDAKESLEIVRAIVTLAHNLGLDVVAEGVETANHVAMLKILKCEFGQGYFYSRPVDAESAEELIEIDTRTQSSISAPGTTERTACGIPNVHEVRMGPSQASPSGVLDSSDLVKSISVYFDNKDNQALKEIMTLASEVDSRKCKAGINPYETQGPTEQKLKEEFEIHIEDLKQEAIKQFDQELYSACLGTFQFLCELEPDNQTLRDYLELTQQLVSEAATKSKTLTNPDPQAPEQNLRLAIESNAGVIKRENEEAGAFVFGNEADEDDQHDNESTDSIAPQIRSSVEVDSEVQNRSPKEKTRSLANSSDKSRNRNSVTLLGAIFAILLVATLDLWTRSEQNSAASSVVPFDHPALPALPDTSSNLAKNRAQEDYKNSARPASASESQPKQLRGTGEAPLAASKKQAQKQSPETFTYTVIHDHLIGSCRGKLKIGDGLILFKPSEDSQHGFALKLTDIIGTELSDVLKIKFKHAVYRFKARFARDQQDNQSMLATIDQRLTRARAAVGPAKH